MKKRVTALLLALCMLFSVCAGASASAIELKAFRASRYLDSYALLITPLGDEMMEVSYDVYGTDLMDKIGAYQIIIEEAIGNKWYQSVTYSGKNHSDFYSYDAYEHHGSFTFKGLPGIYYRAIIVAYAEDGSGSDKITSEPCTAKECI